MKKTQILFYALAFVFIAGIFTACETDPVEVINPEIALANQDGYVYQDTLLQRGQVFKVKLIAQPGTNDLKLVQINENDVAIDLDRIVSGINSNPALTLGGDELGFEKEIELYAQQEGLSKYTFIVEDTEGNTNGVEFTIANVYADLDGEVGDLKVFNFSGPKAGSIDLQTATAVLKTDASGDIRDRGINTDLPAASNWIKKIFPINDAQLFLPEEGLLYDDISSKEALKAAVEAGTEVVLSLELKAGDIYLAKTASNEGETFDYFLLRVDQLVITNNNNEDYYIFTLKQAMNM